VLSCALFLSVVTPSARAATDIPFWHPHHKNHAETGEAHKPKADRKLFHRSKPSREQAARSEATFGMVGPKSVGWRHPEPGPAGFGGAK
jgi:hypothetical protein